MSSSALVAALIVVPILAQESPDTRPRSSEEVEPPSETKQQPTPSPLPAAAETMPARKARTSPVSEQDRVGALNQAKIFFAQLILADARALADEAAIPFYLEDRKINSREELASEWSRNLKGKRTDLLTLYNIEIFSPAEMEQKYGKPPARLKAFPWRASRTLIAVANLSGHAAIALLTRTEKDWRISGFTD